MKRTTIYLYAALALLAGLTACTQDELTDGNSLPAGEYPVIILANGIDVTVTRAAVDGDWQGVNSVALQIGDEVKEYTVTASDADGYRSATLSRTADPFYWTSRDPITVSAWWPCTDDDGNLLTTMPDVKVAENQSKLADFQNSDFISAENQTVVFDDPTLELTHRTALIHIVLTECPDGLKSVQLTGLSTEGGNPANITPYDNGDTYTALVAPQTVTAGTAFITCTFNDGKTFVYRMKKTVEWLEGDEYTYTVSLKAAYDPGYTTTTDDQGNVTGYNVYNADGLLAWAEAAKSNLSLNCTLTADIDLTGKKWTPVGPDDYNQYTGTFDGGGHRITGLTINLPDQDYVGLFGLIGRGGTVKDVMLQDISISGNSNVGGVAGVSIGTITGCTVEGGTVKGTKNNVGGIVGNNQGSVEDCSSSAAVEGYSNVGGVAGHIVSGTVTACTVSGNVSGSGNVGGVAGTSYGTVTACYHAASDVSGTIYNFGGVVGYNGGTVTACYHAMGSVSGQDYIGGVAGFNTGTLTACYWSDSPDKGSGYGSTGGTTKVDGTTVTWTGAITRMNAALSGTGWEYIPGDDGLPVLAPNI